MRRDEDQMREGSRIGDKDPIPTGPKGGLSGVVMGFADGDAATQTVEPETDPIPDPPPKQGGLPAHVAGFAEEDGSTASVDPETDPIPDPPPKQGGLPAYVACFAEEDGCTTTVDLETDPIPPVNKQGDLVETVQRFAETASEQTQAAASEPEPEPEASEDGSKQIPTVPKQSGLAGEITGFADEDAS